MLERMCLLRHAISVCPFNAMGGKLDGRWFLLYWRLSHKLWPTVEDLQDSTIVPTNAGSTHTSIAHIVCAEETVRSFHYLKTLRKHSKYMWVDTLQTFSVNTTTKKSSPSWRKYEKDKHRKTSKYSNGYKSHMETVWRSLHQFANLPCSPCLCSKSFLTNFKGFKLDSVKDKQ